ncbi:MAG: RsmF rRNA methyltransferase first C-terminal domain-containing protein [Lachnospiraceae bacterium]|nr:RsmF rRNA methyltransferase first C-terminal domain-containing protein [Lachnospiraceae bacterium]
MSEKINLPGAFLERMKRLLATEYSGFLESYEQERYYGLRRNPLKASEAEFIEKVPFALEPVSWAREGYYYQAADQPGRHILHEAGAYYIQEPSAMAVVEILDPKPGEHILDLCAAPGGKSTQIAGRMEGKGLLVSNEIIPNRAKVLSQNIERMGIHNCVVCNETPERMAGFFLGFFDRIVVDAPCSGEGMFRKDDTAIAEWSEEHVEMCAQRQYGILTQAATMLKPGGLLVYSTCTFAPDENEGVISRFIREHEDFVIADIPHDKAFLAGRPDWIRNPVEGLERTMRLMPYKIRGEGHYIAALRRLGGKHDTIAELEVKAGKQANIAESKINKKSNVYKFLTEELGLAEDWLKRQHGRIQMFGDQIYLVPEAMVSMDGMKVVRPGLHLGTDKKNRIEPAHALALALDIEETDKKISLSEEEAGRYLHGESLLCEAQKGWTLLTYDGYPLGFGKAANGQMKNHYPRGLRK